MKKSIYLFLYLLFFCNLIFAQEWGEVTQEDLQMTYLEEDREADAVILFDKAEIEITPDFELNLFRHKRIKILTEEGKNRADVKLWYYFKDKITKIEAQSISPEGHIEELDDDNIFDEESEIYKRKVFAIPGVKTGSVIEYSYKLQSEYIQNLEPWRFQNTDFTRLSQLTVRLRKGFSYNAFYRNIVIYNFKPVVSEDWDRWSSGERIPVYTWKLENLPAIKDEPYITNLNDYFATVYFQLNRYKTRYVDISFAKSWDEISEYFKKNYWKLIDDNDTEEFAGSLINENADEEMKIRPIFDFIRDEIETSGINYLNKNLSDPEEIIKNKSGTLNSKNLTLINLLRHVDLDAYPVLMSTRDHGVFVPRWIQTQQFNRIIAAVKQKSGYLFLDTGQKYCPYNILPYLDINGSGLLMTKDHCMIVKIKTDRIKNERIVETTAEINEQGDLIAQSIIIYDGYYASGQRNLYKKSEGDEYFKNKIDHFAGSVLIDTCYCSDPDDPEKPFVVNINYKIEEYAQVVSNNIYFETPFLFSIKSNPFVREKRTFPVDYNYTRKNREIIKLSLPQNFTFSEVPDIAKRRSNLMSYTNLCFKDESTVEINRNFTLKLKKIMPVHYQELRKCYDYIVKSDVGQFVATGKI